MSISRRNKPKVSKGDIKKQHSDSENDDVDSSIKEEEEEESDAKQELRDSASEDDSVNQHSDSENDDVDSSINEEEEEEDSASDDGSVNDINGRSCDVNGDDSSNDGTTSNVETNKIKQNLEWADAMAKILKTNKPKRKKTIVLAKAKKIKVAPEDNNENVIGFEVDGENDSKPKIKKENESDCKLVGKKLEAKLQMARRLRKKELEAKGRVKPSVLNKDREKLLSKVATKGVIQLFNAVRQQQKSLEKEIEKVGPSNVKKDKVLKSVDKKAFLDVLMGAKSQTVPQIKDESESKSEWAVLRDDFMMGTKLKDWDKDEDIKND